MTSQKKRLGRPALPAGERRRHRVVVMLTDAELRRLREIAGGEPLGTAAHALLADRLRKGKR